MGGGIARSLLRSKSMKSVTGYDRAENLVSAFHDEAKSVGKSANAPPKSLNEAVTSDTDAVVIVLVNEVQCQGVCFGGGGDNSNSLCRLMKPKSVVVLCSTVTAQWARYARDRFASNDVHFVDCPISGGAARALSGELTMMASGTDAALSMSKPVLEACGKEVHMIKGGAGMGQTVKMAHQLLAGVHIVATAEALALAAKAGVDVEQMYDIVCGAAGNSWMFGDRGKRMIDASDNRVMSALPVIIKDMDIVYKSAKELRSPIPLASAALQQLLTAQVMGLDAKDDSQVVKVYEAITNVAVGKAKLQRANDKDSIDGLECEIAGLGGKAGDVWNGRKGHIEEYLKSDGRYAILIGTQRVKVRKENFRICDESAAATASNIATTPSIRDRLPMIKRGPINATVIGIGNIGGGMARALLRSPVIGTVTGYDMTKGLVSEFHKEAAKVGKTSFSSPPSNMNEAVTKDTHIVVLTLVNERQCTSVCFGGDNDNLLSRLSPGTCVILCSTVTAKWARYARERFVANEIHFVDSPVSGGAARALTGELTMMASGDDMSLAIALPLLDAAGKEVHLIEGGAGMGQTVKYIHQLLAGVHIVAAAECLALAVKAGVNAKQFYEIVCGAAGYSWMFEDRGRRMIAKGSPPVKSMVDIFVKDLGIVYSEATTLKSPIPLATVALQQFINASALGLGKTDDSEVIMVYGHYLSYKGRRHEI